MTRKDYGLIAEVLLQADISWDATQIISEEFAARLEKDNPKFNKEKFIKACLGESDR